MYKNTFVDRVSLNINIVSNRVARHSSYTHAVNNIFDHSHKTAYHAKMLGLQEAQLSPRDRAMRRVN